MGYKIDNLQIKTNLDSVSDYYKGNNSGTLFFRSPTASNPYGLSATSNGVLYDARWNNGYITNEMVITNTRVSPYFAPYKKNNNPLLFGDEDQYVISGIGWESPLGANNTSVEWRGHVAVSGPASNQDIANLYTVEYQFYYYDANHYQYYYYYHPSGSGTYSWTTSVTTNNGTLGYSGSHLYINLDPPSPSVTYCFKIRLVSVAHPDRKSPWTGLRIKFGERQQDYQTWSGWTYAWYPELSALQSNFVIPYSRGIVQGRTVYDGVHMMPLYGDKIITDHNELNWDW